MLELQNWQEGFGYRLAEVAVLHRWHTDDGHRNHRILAVGDPRDVHNRIGLGKRVVSEVVPERSFHASLAGQCVALYQHVALGWNPEVVGLALDYGQPSAAEQSCEFVLRQVVRQWRNCAEHHFGRATEADRNGHPAACSVGVVRAVLVGLPVQPDLGGSVHLTSVHPHVMDACVCISGDDQRECHERPCVFWPGLRNRQPRDVGHLHHDLLAGPPRDFARSHRHALLGKPDPGPRRLEYTSDVRLHQSDHALSDLPRVVNAQSPVGSLSGSEEVHQQGKLADAAVWQPGLLELQSRTPFLHEAVGEAARLELHIDWINDPKHLVRLLKSLDIAGELPPDHAPPGCSHTENVRSPS